MKTSRPKALSRRQLLAGAAAGGLLASCTGGPDRMSGRPPLKQIVSGRTIDLHVHINAGEWWSLPPSPQPAAGSASALGSTPYFRRVAEARASFRKRMAPEFRDLVDSRAARREARVKLEDDAALVIEECDEAGIDTFVNLTIDNLPTVAPDGRRFGAPFETVLEDNRRVRDAYPGRIITFAGVDPRRGPEAVRLFEKAVREFGCAGYGEHVSTLWRTRPDDRNLVYPLMEKAVELDVPFLVDATMPFGFSDPAVFRRILTDFPELRLAAGGTGSGVAPVKLADGSERPAYEVMLDLAEEFPNFWLDLDDWQSKGFDKGLEFGSPESLSITLNFIKRAMKGPARGRIMYGSDYPIMAGEFTFASWIELLLSENERQSIGITPDEWTLFFSANARDFLRL
jgi:predicted TIM-barrel fold metal-dependent hydrolase